MRAGLERPLDELLGEYAVQAAHTDEVVAAHDLNEDPVRVMATPASELRCGSSSFA